MKNDRENLYFLEYLHYILEVFMSNHHVRLMFQFCQLVSTKIRLFLIANQIMSKAEEWRMHYVWFSQFWSHFRRTSALFASKAKINVWNFSNGGCPKGARSVKIFSKNVDFSLCATTWEYFFDIFKWDQNHENQT